MEPIDVAPGIVRVTTPLPYRPRSVHAYLLDAGGGRRVLVDGGVDTDEAWRALDAGVRASGAWTDLALQLVTHMHVDHVGLVGRVSAASGAPLAMGRLDAERVEHARRHPEEEAGYRSLMLREAGATPALIDRASAVMPPPTGATASEAGITPCDLPLDEQGGPLELDGHELGGWEVVWTPGHTAGHVSLFRRSDRVLIGGDAVLSRVSPTIGVNRQREDPVGDYLDTLRRLEGLRPAVVLPGHGAPLEDPGARIRELVEATEAESEAVLRIVTAEPRTVAGVVAVRYAGRDLPDPAMMQAIRETRAHLDRLVTRGALRAERSGEAVCFSHV